MDLNQLKRSSLLEKATVTLVFIVIIGVIWSIVYEVRNPCTEYQETGRTVCSSYCTNEEDDLLRHCWETCEPEKECVSRQMADGTVWEK